MEQKSVLQSELPGRLFGAQNALLRLTVSGLLSAFVAILWHNRAPFPWIALSGMTFIAIGAGLATFWSP
jgi:hypothetical protein